MLFLLAAVVLAGLGPRPPELTRGDPSAYAAWLADKAVTFDGRVVGARCETAKVSSMGGAAGGPFLFKAPEPDAFVGSSALEHLKLEGCGRVRLENILVYPLKLGGWRAVGLLDGSSIASAQLEIDALSQAKIFLVAGAPCTDEEKNKSFVAGSVSLLQPPSHGAWSELWPARVCGDDVAVRVDFTPDVLGKGTVFTISRVSPDGSNLTRTPPSASARP